MQKIYDKQAANAIRLQKLIYLKHKNYRLAYDIKQYLSKVNTTNENTDYLNKLYRHIVTCASHSLIKDLGGSYEYVSSHTCKDKLCVICNAERKRTLRNKYIAWFDRNPVLWEDGSGVYTESTRTADCTPVAYDLMHLTLTVPHTERGYKGERIYYRQLIADFNRLRKTDSWKQYILGGEYGIEATENESGLHIHIHSLLFVRQFRRSRDIIHLAILQAWNQITIDRFSTRTVIDDAQAAAIRKGNQLITDDVIESLSPFGATLIGLENIYVLDELRKKHYANDSKEARIKAVLETISYHFKPKMFERSDGSFDVQELVNIYVKTYKMVLYRRFGALHKESCLNLKDTTMIEELEAAKEAEQAIGGNEVEAAMAGYRYFVVNPMNLYVKDKTICVKSQAKTINLDLASNTHTAMLYMQSFIRKNS